MSNRRLLLTCGMMAAFLTWAAVTVWANFAHAQTLTALQQLDFSTAETSIGSGSAYVSNWGQGYTGVASSVSLFLSGDATSTPNNNINFKVLQYSDAGYSSLIGACDFTASVIPSAPQLQTWTDVYATFGLGCTVVPSSYVQIDTVLFWEPFDTNAYGTALPPAGVSVVAAGASVEVPYFQIAGLSDQIDWSLITTPPPFTLGTTSAAIAASSSLWGSLALASSSVSCDTGNIVSDGLCTAFSFLILPAPSTFEAYASLPQDEQGHWPFSWIYGVEEQLTTATSSAGRLPSYSLDLTTAASTTFASTTMPNFMPSFTFFSSSTVMTYLPASDWAALQALLAAVLWLGLVVDIFFMLRNRFHRV